MYIEEVSLEELIGLEDEENGLIQDGVYPNNQVREGYVKEKIAAVLERLTTREREIVSLFWGLDGLEPKTMKEIGDLFLEITVSNHVKRFMNRTLRFI